jgi:predicted amidohydrolase YtcJ
MSSRASAEVAMCGPDRARIRAEVSAFAADPVTCDPDDLIDLPVRLTVVDGQVVYRAES